MVKYMAVYLVRPGYKKWLEAKFLRKHILHFHVHAHALGSANLGNFLIAPMHFCLFLLHDFSTFTHSTCNKTSSKHHIIDSYNIYTLLITYHFFKHPSTPSQPNSTQNPSHQSSSLHKSISSHL